MRVKNWQTRLIETLEGFSGVGFKWGTADCMQLALACSEAMTGIVTYPNAHGYKTERGALRVLKKHGFDNCEQAIEAAFDEKPVIMAGRGDIGIIDTPEGPAALVCVGNQFVGISPDSGFIYLPRAMVRRAFEVN